MFLADTSPSPLMSRNRRRLSYSASGQRPVEISYLVDRTNALECGIGEASSKSSGWTVLDKHVSSDQECR